QLIASGDEVEMVQFLDAVLTNETRFFREISHFEFLEQTVFPAWKAQGGAQRQARLIRVWSAACSSGEEPYSLAMTLLHHFPQSAGWRIEILATDLSTKVLDKAQAALWPLEKASQI